MNVGTHTFLGPRRVGDPVLIPHRLPAGWDKVALAVEALWSNPGDESHPFVLPVILSYVRGRVARRLHGDREIDDLVEQVVEKVLRRRRRTCFPPLNPRAYLNAVVSNEVKNELRRRRRTAVHCGGSDLPVSSSVSNVLDLRPDWDDPIGRVVDRVSAEQDCARILDRCSPSDAEIGKAYLAEARRTGESPSRRTIASLVGCSHTEVGRAFQRMRSAW